MFRMLTVIATIAALALPAGAQENQPGLSPWRALAANVPAGSTVKVRLTDGRRFNAVLIEAREEAVILQPKTRQAVPVQPLPYSAIAALERVEAGGGLSAGKAIAIGAAAGGAVFFGILVAMLAALD